MGWKSLKDTASTAGTNEANRRLERAPGNRCMSRMSKEEEKEEQERRREKKRERRKKHSGTQSGSGGNINDSSFQPTMF